MAKTAMWLLNRYEFNGLLKHQGTRLLTTCSESNSTFIRPLPIFPGQLTDDPDDGRLIGQ